MNRNSIHWILPHNEVPAPKSEVLAIDSRGKTMIGLLFQDNGSKTGYVCYSLEDEQIDCSAYVALDRIPLKSCDDAILTTTQILAANDVGKYIIGKASQLPDGTILVSNDSSIMLNAIAYCPIEVITSSFAINPAA